MSIEERVKAIQARWEAFAPKVQARVDEILAEADPGFDELIATEALDPAPLSSALSEFDARMRGLSKKVDDAWEKIDPDLDGAMDEAEGAQVQRVAKLRDELLRKKMALAGGIERSAREMSVRKSAEGARALLNLARAEMEKAGGGKKCSACGAPIKPESLTEPSTVSCSHCKAVNDVHPGPATALFYGGIALHALAEEAALPEEAERLAEEKRFHGLRHATLSDQKRFEDASLAYWRAYAKTFVALTPGAKTADQVEKMAQAKVGSLRLDFERDAPFRKVLDQAMACASVADKAGVERALADDDAQFSLDELLVGAHEHGDKKAVELLLGMLHRQEASDEPAAKWKAEKLAELDRDLAGRIR
ncbi:MAG TPA: hypothetical protein VGK67_41400 [Myxococcales bacterium]|jgi:hypothetical protein